MGALVEKLTGMELLDYLRTKFLDELGFSKEAFILKSPDGKVSMGGSGMCATPQDILKVMYLRMANLMESNCCLPDILRRQLLNRVILMENQAHGKRCRAMATSSG